MKKVIIVALAVTLCASVSMASVITLTSNPKDQVVYGINTNPPAWVGQATARVGYDVISKQGDAYIMVFTLPTLPAGETISSASLYTYSTVTVGNNVKSWNIDVYGVRAADSTAVSTNDFFDGANDPNATKVIDDYVQIITTNKTAVGAYYSTTNTSFGAWLTTLYTGNVPNYSNAFVRMNADVAYANMTNNAGYQIASCYPTFATGDDPIVSQRPVLTLYTIPEPATVGMLGLGALVTLLGRRFRNR